MWGHDTNPTCLALSIGIFFPNQIGVLYHVAQNPQD